MELYRGFLWYIGDNSVLFGVCRGHGQGAWALNSGTFSRSANLQYGLAQLTGVCQRIKEDNPYRVPIFYIPSFPTDRS